MVLPILHEWIEAYKTDNIQVLIIEIPRGSQCSQGICVIPAHAIIPKEAISIIEYYGLTLNDRKWGNSPYNHSSISWKSN
jgi:hypothetical protein